MNQDSDLEMKFYTQDNDNLQAKTLLAARTAYNKNEFSEALKLYLNVIHKVLDSNVYIEIGNCYYKLNSFKEALDYWEKAIKLSPENAKAYSNIGNLYYKKGEAEKAISFWLVALTLEPEDARTSLNIAIAFDRKDMRFEAIRYFEKYIKYEESKVSEEYIKIKNNIKSCYDTAKNFLNIGVQLQSQNENAKAANMYFKALANYPNLSKVNLNLGSIFFMDKNYELAIKYWLNAYHLEPTFDKTYSNLAISYDLMEKYDYAYAYYQMYMNFVIASNKEEYYKVNRRVAKLKSYLQKHNDLIEKHLILAQKNVLESKLYEAIDEYKIYSILKPEVKKEYVEVIKKLESYINPEANIIAKCFEEGEKLLRKRNFKEAKEFFARIMKLSSQRLLEYSKAKAKFVKCEKEEIGYND